jgi:hypothetical protein
MKDRCHSCAYRNLPAGRAGMTEKKKMNIEKEKEEKE